MKEKKARVDDASHATRAAVEEGIVPGGGVAYIRALESLDKVKGANDDETTGVNIVRRALEEPLRIIAANAGAERTVPVTLDNHRACAAGTYLRKGGLHRHRQFLSLGVFVIDL